MIHREPDGVILAIMKRKITALAGILSVLTLLACGGAGQCFSWTVAAIPFPLTIQAGGSGLVTMESLIAPDEINVSSFTGQAGITIAKTTGREFRVSVASSVPAGTYTMAGTFTADGIYCSTSSANIQVVVTPANNQN